jgi:cytoplasmic tRNA 2-thiolation protein 1
MPPIICVLCNTSNASMKRPKNGDALCRPCFFRAVEDDCHNTIINNKLFVPGEVIACGASGGKDSTVLMHLLQLLNERHNYGIKLHLVSVDEGITGYRDESLVTVRRNSQQYNLPLTIVSYADLYGGWSMDKIVAKIGSKSNCTYCGVFRRHALEKGAHMAKANKIATGHNCDDTAETVLMNMLRSDMPRLERCTKATTNEVADEDGPLADTDALAQASIPRVKPMRDLYEKEIVLYAHYQNLDYFSTECTYSKEAFRGNARTLLKQLESISPRCIANIVQSGEDLFLKEDNNNTAKSIVMKEDSSEENANNNHCGCSSNNKLSKINLQASSSSSVGNNNNNMLNTDVMSMKSYATTAGGTSTTITVQVAQRCKRCGSLSSRALCRACVLVESLNGTGPKLAVGGGV